jgi:hypothetical protein
MSSIRKRLTDEEAKYLGKAINSKEKGRSSSQYRLTQNEWAKIKELRTLRQSEFKEVKRTLNDKGEIIYKVEKREQKKLIDIPDGHQIKRLSTNTTTGQQWIITEPNKDKDVAEFDIESIIKKHIKPIKFKARKFPVELNDFDTLTISDVHIGMDTNKFKNSMYADKWDSEEVLKVADIIYNKVVDEQSSQTLVIDELGDLLDGYNAKTTRGGHSLPQNMTNEEAFDLALNFKMYIADRLVNVYPNIIFNNVCNDNHAGSFGYFVNSAFKSIINQKYKHLEVNNYRQFISHYYTGDIAFVITHGKDDVALKFGFKPHLDTKQIEKIDQYCKQKGIYKRAKRIIFKKGDSHQALFDMSGSDDFDYYNYPALSPSSQWVQTNFKKGRKGFVIEHYKGLENIIKPFFL